jgi:hypothetical protein
MLGGAGSGQVEIQDEGAGSGQGRVSCSWWQMCSLVLLRLSAAFYFLSVKSVSNAGPVGFCDVGGTGWRGVWLVTVVRSLVVEASYYGREVQYFCL